MSKTATDITGEELGRGSYFVLSAKTYVTETNGRPQPHDGLFFARVESVLTGTKFVAFVLGIGWQILDTDHVDTLVVDWERVPSHIVEALRSE